MNSTPQTITNFAGHALGAVLFGIFLVLAARQTAVPDRPARLPLVAAGLALLWDVASIAILALGGEGAVTGRVLAMVAFGCLSLLPAILLHICANAGSTPVVRLGYLLSGTAMACHVSELVSGWSDLHRIGLGIITAGFGALTVLLFALELRSRDRAQPGTFEPGLKSSRLLAAMALLLFSASFVHLGSGHMDQAWSAELFVHHAGIPLSLFILLQDYRFVFADAFIRMVATVFLAVAFGWAVLLLPESLGFARLVAAAALIALFGGARAKLHSGLTALLFASPASKRVEAAIQAIRSATSEGESIEIAIDKMAELMGSTPVTDPAHAAVSIPIRLSAAESKAVLLGIRQNRRPYLSFDLEALRELADAAAERVSQIRQIEGDRLMTEAEMKALHAQIHPHFLFNALNTVYGITPRTATVARRAITDLADIFRYLLDTKKGLAPVGDELRVVRAYLAIERHRFGDRLQCEVEVDPGLEDELLPALTIQPLVENAIKHGVAPCTEGGMVVVEVRRVEGTVAVSVFNTGAGPGAGTPSRGTGVGLDNVTRRLRLHFGPDAGVALTSNASGTTARFSIPSSSELAAVSAHGARQFGHR